MRQTDRRYFATWLKRTGKELSQSGRLSQLAVLLVDGEFTAEQWRERLQQILRGEEIPTLDLLMRIDSILASPAKQTGIPDSQGSLF